MKLNFLIFNVSYPNALDSLALSWVDFDPREHLAGLGTLKLSHLKRGYWHLVGKDQEF